MGNPLDSGLSVLETGAPPSPDAHIRASVIIPHFQMPEALDRCLASVKAQTLDRGRVEIIVVDNNSAAFPHEVAARHPDVQFLSEARPGPGLARNTGAAAAKAELLVFIDADCRAAPGWLQAAVRALEQGAHDGLKDGIVGGDVCIDFLNDARLTGIEAYEAVFAYRQRMYIEKMGFSGTGNLGTFKPVLADVGPFGGIDIAEDKDWGQRATAKGYRVRYIDDMRIYHPGRTSFAELQRKWQRHIAHSLAAHHKAGKPLWRWQLFCTALILSIPVDGLRLLFSPRLSGLKNRLRGIGVLARLRLWRARQGLLAARGHGPTAGDTWTRQ
jgi:GT2 family glycosyltransferase